MILCFYFSIDFDCNTPLRILSLFCHISHNIFVSIGYCQWVGDPIDLLYRFFFICFVVYTFCFLIIAFATFIFCIWFACQIKFIFKKYVFNFNSFEFYKKPQETKSSTKTRIWNPLLHSVYITKYVNIKQYILMYMYVKLFALDIKLHFFH